MLLKYDKLICSRIFDEGISLPDLRSVIEYDFLGKSRRQELQRATRLCHSRYTGLQYHILMSPVEFEKYKRRLYALYSRGFDIKVEKD